MLPPVVGYRVVAGLGAVISISLTSFAGLAMNKKGTIADYSFLK